MTSTAIGTPLAMESKTTDRSVPRCTTWRSFSAGASPEIRMVIRICSYPLRKSSVLMPNAPCTFRSPSRVDSTEVRRTPRAAAEYTSEVVTQAARACSRYSAALHVQVTLEGRLDGGQAYATGGGRVHQRGGDAGGEGVQQVLGRVRAGVGAQQNRGLTGVEDEGLGARGVLAAGGVEILDRRPVVRSAQPPVVSPELELGD